MEGAKEENSREWALQDQAVKPKPLKCVSIGFLHV